MGSDGGGFTYRIPRSLHVSLSTPPRSGCRGASGFRVVSFRTQIQEQTAPAFSFPRALSVVTALGRSVFHRSPCDGAPELCDGGIRDRVENGCFQGLSYVLCLAAVEGCCYLLLATSYLLLLLRLLLLLLLLLHDDDDYYYCLFYYSCYYYYYYS